MPQFRTTFANSASTVTAGEKVQLALRGSRPRAIHRAIDEPCTLPPSLPKGATKTDFAVLPIKLKFCRKRLLQIFFVRKLSAAEL